MFKTSMREAQDIRLLFLVIAVFTALAYGIKFFNHEIGTSDNVFFGAFFVICCVVIICLTMQIRGKK